MGRVGRWIVAFTLVSAAALTIGGWNGPTAIVQAQGNLPSPTPRAESICQQVLTRAIDLTEQNCDATGRNEACYGSNRVRVQLQNGLDPQSVRFEQSGDIAPVRRLARIETRGLDLDTGDWGIALVKLQANLPDTNPGQNVTFILYGNTSLSTAAGQTNAFYLSTGLGEVLCNELPSSSLMVRAPGHVEVAFTLNGVEIRLASTLLLAADGASLTARLLEGHASLTAFGQTAALVAGQEASVPLDPETGSAAGAPTEPTTFEYQPTVETLGGLVDALSGESLEGTTTIQGPIELIDPQGGWITVDGHRIHVPPGQLAALQVGQPLRFTGYGHGFIVFEVPPDVTVPEGGRLSPATLNALRRSLGLDLSDSQRAGRPGNSSQGNVGNQGNQGNRANRDGQDNRDREHGDRSQQGNSDNRHDDNNRGGQDQN